MAENVPDCLACAVRELTEGKPGTVWAPSEEGESISGVVVRIGEEVTAFGTPALFVDLWQGGTDRARVVAYSAVMSALIRDQDPKVGDRVTFTYVGRRTIERGTFEGRSYRDFRVTVERGHH